MAAIQLQLEMRRGLWAGRQPSSEQNATSETGWEKSIHLVECHRSPSYRGGRDRQRQTSRRTDAQTDRQTEGQTDIDTGRQTER